MESGGSRVSMDGRGRWMVKVFFERLWRLRKCERICLSSCENLHELEAAIDHWMNDCNHRSIHQDLGYTTSWDNHRPAA
ncbi:MAG: hypothetical protein ACOYOL_06895 [Chthoniobacterales bacterium]